MKTNKGFGDKFTGACDCCGRRALAIFAAPLGGSAAILTCGGSEECMAGAPENVIVGMLTSARNPVTGQVVTKGSVVTREALLGLVALVEMT